MCLIACETMDICVYPLSLSTYIHTAGRLPICPAVSGSPLKFQMSTIVTATSFLKFDHTQSSQICALHREQVVLAWSVKKQCDDWELSSTDEPLKKQVCNIGFIYGQWIII